MSSTPQSIIPFRSRADRTDRDSTGRPGGSDTVLDGIPDQLDQLADTIDRAVHANLARQTGGLSPAALAGAYADWAVHLASSPGKQAQLLGKALRKGWRFANHVASAMPTDGPSEPCIEPLPQDRRFTAEEWQHWPYSLIHQAFLLAQQWWH